MTTTLSDRAREIQYVRESEAATTKATIAKFVSVHLENLEAIIALPRSPKYDALIAQEIAEIRKAIR